MIKNKIKISDSKKSKSLDMLVTAKQNPDTTTRPTILNHTTGVVDPMISRSDKKDFDNVEENKESNDSTVTQLEVSSDNSADENSNIASRITKRTHHNNEDLKRDLVNSGQYFLNIENSKSIHLALRLVFVTLVVVTCLSVGMLFIK